MKEVLVTQTMSNLHPKERSESEGARGRKGEKKNTESLLLWEWGALFSPPDDRQEEPRLGSLLGWGVAIEGRG